MKIQGSVLSITALLIATASSCVYAMPITVEPDGFSAGTDLTHVSPYVTINSNVCDFEAGNAAASPVYAMQAVPPYLAPTGHLSFGNFAFDHCGNDGGPLEWAGFALNFNQAVNHVAIGTLNFGYSFSFAVEWMAFDKKGSTLGSGLVPANLGEPFALNIPVKDVWAVVAGGVDGIGAIEFDHLTFDIDDASTVPEPGALSLMLLGVVVVLRKLIRNSLHKVGSTRINFSS